MSRPWRVMVIGSVDSGKSTLLGVLSDRAVRTVKTESIDFCGDFVDTPGEFLDIPLHYNSLISTSSKASVVLLLVDPTRNCPPPPTFSSVICAPVVGVVTKSDLASSEQIERAKKSLRRSGVRESCVISSITGEGLEFLKSTMERYRPTS